MSGDGGSGASAAPGGSPEAHADDGTCWSIVAGKYTAFCACGWQDDAPTEAEAQLALDAHIAERRVACDGWVAPPDEDGLPDFVNIEPCPNEAVYGLGVAFRNYCRSCAPRPSLARPQGANTCV